MRRYKRTTLITVGCLAALAGLGLARKLQFFPPEWIFIFWPALLILRRRTALGLILVVILGLGLGLWRGAAYSHKLAELKSLATHPVTIEATALTDSVYGNNSQIQFTANQIQLVEPYQKPLAGTFKISGFGVHMIYRGDRVEVSGKLYPTRGSNQATIAYAQLAEISTGHSFFADISRKFTTGMQNALPEPLASFGLGLLVGLRTIMPQDILNQLTAVSLVHIVAVSGYNLTIIVRGIARLKIRSKYQRTMLSLALIGLFVMVTGFSASIIRAALVSALSLWAAYYGRRVKPMVLISFAAALTGLMNPFYVWGDLSWYLSFLAFFGILIIAPTIQARLFSRQPKLITAVLLETLSAELMTLPLIMMSFSQLSIISLLANLLVVPLVPLAMLLAATAAFVGALLPQLAGWFAWPAVVLLTYMLDVVHILANIPSVLLHTSISVNLMLTFYVILLLSVLTMRRRARMKLSEIETVLIR
ncbi:MAG TPA: ComEC/Rec2 family competence protein [Candidatus Saccharimonadales bacterium]|nr:ComEC/Rec2 family competence protein [Candidatus Saccharimonadales bacterium]